jgi:hypothetical protein
MFLHDLNRMTYVRPRTKKCMSFLMLVYDVCGLPGSIGALYQYSTQRRLCLLVELSKKKVIRPYVVELFNHASVKNRR